VKNLLAKLGAHSRLEAAALARKEGLLGDEHIQLAALSAEPVPVRRDVVIPLRLA
jgi:hypothetical protein